MSYFTRIGGLKRIAGKNLARHKVKSFLTILAIMVSVSLYIFMDGWISGMSIESRRNIVNYEIGAAKLQTKLYFDKKDELPAYERFQDWELYRDALDEGGYDAAPRFTFAGTIYSQAGIAPAMIIGVDPEAEKSILSYTRYVDTGRYVSKGAFEVALGIMAADKLQVGIPQRPTRKELEGEILQSIPEEERAFVLSLYEPVDAARRGFMEPEDRSLKNGDEYMILSKNIPQKDLEKCWDLFAATGRNDIRIASVIDIKAAPDLVWKDRWEKELIPRVSSEAGRRRLEAAYEYDPDLEAYLLIEKDEAALERILDAMIIADFAGAIRHVNQLVNAVVVGTINSPDPATNGAVAYIPLDVLQDERGMALEGGVTELIIRSRDRAEHRLPGKTEEPEAIRAALESSLASRGRALPEELSIFGWMDYVKDYLGYESMENASTKILTILLFILSFMGISNTMLMAILERTREIGMMRAMGMTDGDMILVYMLEALYLGFIGSVLGILAGCLINMPMVKYGIDFSAMMDAMEGGVGYRVASNFRSMWNIPVIVLSGVAATALSACMALIPTRRAVKMAIVDSLRFE